MHNDYVTGGLEPARVAGAGYLVPAAAHVSRARTPVADVPAEAVIPARRGGRR